MWVHEGGIATPFIARWPAGIAACGAITPAVGHVMARMPILVERAGAKSAEQIDERRLTPPEGRSLVPDFRGTDLGDRTLAWEREGNRAIRSSRWKLVAAYKKPWELFDLGTDRSECHDPAREPPERVKALAAEWKLWADRTGVVPGEQWPGTTYASNANRRKTSERH
jgi:arylsulfatase